MKLETAIFTLVLFCACSDAMQPPIPALWVAGIETVFNERKTYTSILPKGVQEMVMSYVTANNVYSPRIPKLSKWKKFKNTIQEIKDVELPSFGGGGGWPF